MMPSWVERTARICEVWSDGELSIRARFEEADPDLSDKRSFLRAVSSYLGDHPKLCTRWQGYVSDKRSSPSPLLDLRGPTTGWMTTKGQRFCPRYFESAEEACAHFLWMEANWVLRRVRTWADAVPTEALAQIAEEESKEAFDSALEEFRAAQGLEISDAIEVVAVVVAEQFLKHTVSFEQGDQILNLLWIRITDDLVEQGTSSSLPKLAYDIYDAFDAGEYDHGDGKDPVMTHTIPALQETLTNLGA